MRSKNKTDGQKQPSFTQTARRAQIIECAIETIASLGYAQASLAQIARRAGISKGVISYYFNSKEQLMEQIVEEIYTAGAQAMAPRIATQPTATLMLRAYIQANLEFLGAHRTQLTALIEIMLNYRDQDGKPYYSVTKEAPVLEALESLLRKGQQDGEFRSFDTRVMAVTIRRAIDAVPALFEIAPDLDVNAYARELAELFERAARKDT